MSVFVSVRKEYRSFNACIACSLELYERCCMLHAEIEVSENVPDWDHVLVVDHKVILVVFLEHEQL